MINTREQCTVSVIANLVFVVVVMIEVKGSSHVVGKETHERSHGWRWNLCKISNSQGFYLFEQEIK
jgi:hypothetical protein